MQQRRQQFGLAAQLRTMFPVGRQRGPVGQGRLPAPRRREAVSVSAYKHPRYTHRVRFPGLGGKRKDRPLTNETDALAFAKTQRKETGENGSAFGSIGERERTALAFWRAFADTASPKPPELLTVLKDFKVGWLASTASVSVADAVATFLAHQKAEGSGERHLASLKSRPGRLEADRRSRRASSSTFLEPLSQIIARMNDLFAAENLSDADLPSYASTIVGKIQENAGVMAQVRNNSAEQKMLGDFPKVVEEAVLGSGDAHHELMTQFLASKPLQNGFARLLLEMLSKTA